MSNLDAFHQTISIGQQEEHGIEHSANIPKAIFMPKYKKRKRLSLSRLREMKADIREKQSCGKPKIKKQESKERWSAERYKLAERTMWEVLKDEGATFENPVTRPVLRMAARKHIGDTGLLDHLLKHINGKVAPGGSQRFQRRFNTNGIMEYWLESADLDKVHREAGVHDPIPPSTLRAGSAPSQNTDSIGELKMLKIEMAQVKKYMQELNAMKQETSEMYPMEEMQKSFVKWKAITEQRVVEIMTSLKCVQDMQEDMLNWKTKAEQQLMEITNKLSDVQVLREHNTSSYPSVRWEDWPESADLCNIQSNEFAPWFVNHELLNVPQDGVLQDPNSTPPTQPCSEQLTNMRSDMLEMVPEKLKEDQPNVTPDSSMSVNSTLDVDNSLILCQEMFRELFTWRDKMEQQLLEVSDTAYHVLTMRYPTLKNQF